MGEVISLNNGVYTIKAPIIGNIQASASDVVSITNGNGRAQDRGIQAQDQQVILLHLPKQVVISQTSINALEKNKKI